MKVYKNFLPAAFFVIFSGAALVVSAQGPSGLLNPESFLNQLLGGNTPTSTEDVLQILLKQQDDIRNSGASLAIAPEFPGQNENVEARLTSYSFDTGSSYITWTRNGKTALAGRGERVYKFTTGSVGSKETISLSAISLDGKEFTASKTFYIGGLDIIWTAQTVIPSEFRGKALASPRSKIFVTAFPQFVVGGRSISPSSLYYEWTLDDKDQNSASGSGKRTFSFYASVATGAEHNISLKVYNSDKSVVSQKSITLTTRDPEVLIYEEDPSGGPIISRAIKDFEMFAGEEKRFRALPYFFSDLGAGDLSFGWNVDGKKVDAPMKPDLLGVTLTNDAAGTVSVDLLVESAKNIIQRARNGFIINVF